MDMIDCIRTRRSVRNYTDQIIPRETMSDLMQLGTLAATGSNQQPWGFVVLQDRAEIDALNHQIKAHLLERLEEYPYLKQYEAGLRNPNFSVLNQASNLLIIYGDTDAHYCAYDGTLAAGNIMLAAHSMGLGTCWIGFAEHEFNTKEFKSLYHIPERYALVCPMTLGYPVGTQEPPVRKPPLLFSR